MPIDIRLNEWITFRVVIKEEHAEFYINDDNKLILVVSEMKHGAQQKGKIEFFVGIGTKAFYKDLKIVFKD